MATALKRDKLRADDGYRSETGQASRGRWQLREACSVLELSSSNGVGAGAAVMQMVLNNIFCKKWPLA